MNYLRLLTIVPAISLVGLTGCQSVDGTARIRSTANMVSAVPGNHETGENVTIGPSTYNTKNASFDRPWPFGPESNPQ